MKRFEFLFCSMFVLIWAFAGKGPTIDLTQLQSHGCSWTQVMNSEEDQHLAWSSQHWLMCFLHWRPLTETNRHLNPLYVRDRLLHFWGFDMSNFSLGELEGADLVNGHEAYYVSGTFRKMVQTRFMIWNCPESSRQFIADLNINTRMSTPRFLFDLQQLITKTVCCHGDCAPTWPAILPQRASFEDLNISFAIPESWRAQPFQHEKWYPEGPQKEKGSIWTLMTDSGKRLDILWLDSGSSVDNQLFHQFFKQLREAKIPEGESPMENFSNLSFGTYDGLPSCTGTFQVAYPEETDAYLFKAFLVERGDLVYFVMVSCINYQEIWYRKVDLRPSPKVFQEMVHEQILPCIGLFDSR